MKFVWLGFDCAHYNDALSYDPNLAGLHLSFSTSYGTVKSQAYLENECVKLCKQARLVSNS